MSDVIVENKTFAAGEELESLLPLLKRTRAASAAIRNLSDAKNKALLLYLADKVVASIPQLLEANREDLDRMDDQDPKKDRLLLTEARLNDLAHSLREVASLENPSGRVLLERTLEQGLQLKKIAVPLGVVGVIYESRPNVTLDVAALCLRSGNACVLKGGKEAFYSNQALVALIHEALEAFGIPAEAVLLLPTDRRYVTELLSADRYVDILIPRGSEALIRFVRENSSIPTIETGAGVCHTYVERTADLEKAKNIVVNAKVSRPSVCNSLDCIVVDKAVADAFLPMLKDDFVKWNVEVFADTGAYPILEAARYPYLQHARETDFGREFLDYKCAVRIVNNTDEAIDHIQSFSSRHSEAIVSKDASAIERFLNEIDAAAVYANASTRFTDGGVFGLGAEIGISTQKLHARGPFALEKLVTEKWVVTGDGQVR